MAGTPGVNAPYIFVTGQTLKASQLNWNFSWASQTGGNIDGVFLGQFAPIPNANITALTLVDGHVNNKLFFGANSLQLVGTNLQWAGSDLWTKASLSKLSQLTNDLNLGITSTVTVGQGGTGAVTLSGLLVGNGTSAVTGIAPGTNGLFLQSTGTGFTWAAASGGTVSFNNVALTGVPTAPTPDGNTATQVPNVQYVNNKLTTNAVTLTAAQPNAAAVMKVTSANAVTYDTVYKWPLFTCNAPTSGFQWKYRVQSAGTITGFYIEAPGAATGSNNFTATVIKNGSTVVTSLTGSVATTTLTSAGSTIACAKDDVLLIQITAITGSVPQASIQPVGNEA